MKLSIWFDGSCYPKNPSKYTVGACIIKNENQTLYKVHKKETHLEITSNNYAEWKGLRIALEIIKHIPFTECTIYGDSQMVIKQINSEYRIKNSKMYSEIAKDTFKYFKANFTKDQINFIWIPREENFEADELTK